MTVGEKVKSKRDELGITQDELAQMTGYSGKNRKTSINKIEKGLQGIPKNKIPAFAKALDMDISELAEWSDKIEKSRDSIFLEYIRSLGCDFVWEDSEHKPAIFYGDQRFFAEYDTFPSLKKKIDDYTLTLIKSTLMDLKTFDQVFNEQKEELRKKLQKKDDSE